MALLRGAQKFNHLFQSATLKRQPLSPLLRHSLLPFSTGNDQPQPPLPQFSDPLFNTSSPGVVYGRLYGVNENTLKTDIINLLEGCDLTLDDIKVDYDRMFYPMAMVVQFPSRSKFSAAFKDIARKGPRLFRLEEVDRQLWDLMTPYNGSYVLLQGIPRNALIDDVTRFLSGCNYDSSSLELFTRNVQSDTVRLAKVRFPSQIEAMNAIIQKNGSFCLNRRIVTRLIQ